MKSGALRIVVALATLVLAAVSIVGYRLFTSQPSPVEIERQLLTETPLGASREDVVRWLAARGIRAEVHVVKIDGPSDYPLTRTGGTSFIHETLDRSRLLFRTSVEVFYIFDTEGRLVDLRVRRTTDSL